jgi:hypothetical protein
LQAAAAQDSRVLSGLPAGRVIYNPNSSQSPLALDPSGFTFLGPHPEQTDGCYSCYNYGPVSGRVNAIMADPVMTNVVYVGSNGGGVWRSTNCCSSSSVFVPTTDQADINAISISDITVDPNNHNVVYAGTGDRDYPYVGEVFYGSQGILKSTNQGVSWTVVGRDVFTPGVILPGTTQLTEQAVNRVRVDPRNSNNVVAGTKQGVYFLYDAGATWSGPCLPNATATTQRQYIYTVLLHNTGTHTDVYVSVGWYASNRNGANGVYRTAMPASGCPASWTLLTSGANGWPAGTGSGTAGNAVGRIDLAIAPSNPSVLYAQVSNADTTSPLFASQLGVWRSTNGGTSWNQQSGPGALSGCGFNYPQNFYDQGIVVDPNNPDVLIMDTYDIWKSTDGGVTFLDLTCGYGGGTTVHVDQHALSFVGNSSSQLLAGNDGGAYATYNMNVISPTRPSFIQLNNTIGTIEFYSGDTTGHFATGLNPGANGGSQDNGSSVTTWSNPANVTAQQWQLRVGGDGFFGRIEPVLNQRWYQENNGGHIWLSSTGPYGVYNDVSAGWVNDANSSFIIPYEIAQANCPPTGCTHLIVGTYRIWEAIDGGIAATSWYTNSPDLTKNVNGANGYINQISYARSMSTTAIVGTQDGNVQYGFGLGQGTAQSATWVNVTGGNAVLPNRPILDVTTDPANPLVGYAAIGAFTPDTPTTPGHVYQVTCTANCGSFTWADKTGNLPDIPADAIVVNPRFPQQVFVGTDWGLYFTNNISASTPVWTRFDSGLPHVRIYDLRVDGGDTTLTAWTQARGAYAWPLPAAPFVQPTATATVTGTPPTATALPSATATPAVAPCPVYTVMTGTATIISGTTDIGNHCDDCATTVNLPFPVTLYDQTFTRGYAQSNGSFEFGPASASLSTSCLPDRNQQYAVIVYQADQCTTGCGGVSCPTCGIFTTTTGTAPNRKFVVEWRTILFGQNAPANYEVVFTENSSTVSAVYGATSDNGAGEEAGIQKTASSTWTQYSCGTPSLTNGRRVDYVLQPCATPTATATATAQATATPVNCPLPFTDVDRFNPFYQYIQCLYCRGIISGYADNTFRWTANVTRGQVAKIIANSAGLNDTISGQTFTDVPPGQPFYQYIERLYRHGAISGYNTAANCPSGIPCFRPELSVTRGQLAKIDANAAGYNETPPTGTQSFRDVPARQPFYVYIERLSLHGVINGYTCGGPVEPCPGFYYRPNANITRGQVSKVASQTFFPNACAPAPRPTVTATRTP